jgi:hypothetical protein
VEVWRLALCMMIVGGCDRVMQLIEVKGGVAPDGAGGDTDARSRPVGCPADYLISLASSASYYKALAPMEWRAAAAACAMDRKTSGAETHLVVLSNDAERQEATLWMGNVEWWIGYSDLHGPENVFRWVTSEDTGGYPTNKQLPWDSDQPDATGPACAEVRTTGQLHDEACTDASSSLCECDLFADVPANR